MTGRKSRFRAGRRPDVEECLEAWWRVSDSPAGRILPSTPHGLPGDRAALCDPFDLYCWRVVGEAVERSKTRGIPATRLEKLIVHRQCGGRFSDFRLRDPIELDPKDPRGFRSKAREVTEIDRVGIDDAWIARAAYAKFRRVLKDVIESAEPYLPPRHSC